MTHTSIGSDQALAAPAGVSVCGPCPTPFREILTFEALEFVADLQRRFGASRELLLSARETAQQRLDADGRLDFLAKTADIRAAEWRVAPIPKDLADRTVEITGPVDRKMIINALNSGAERVHGGLRGQRVRRPGPTWSRGRSTWPTRCDRTIDFAHPDDWQAPTASNDESGDAGGAAARLAPRRAPRHRRRPADVGVASSTSRCTSSTTRSRADRIAAAGPYFYLPKMESHLEARLWNDHLRTPRRRRSGDARRARSARRC